VRERRLPPPLFSAPDEPSVPPPDPEEGRRQGVEDGEKDKGQYYVNMGDAIRTLREDLPVAFYREPNFHVYRFVRFFSIFYLFGYLKLLAETVAINCGEWAISRFSFCSTSCRKFVFFNTIYFI
jgi:hypothetical protein